MRGGAVIPALSLLALALVAGQAVIIRRGIEPSELRQRVASADLAQLRASHPDLTGAEILRRCLRLQARAERGEA